MLLTISFRKLSPLLSPPFNPIIIFVLILICLPLPLSCGILNIKTFRQLSQFLLGFTICVIAWALGNIKLVHNSNGNKCSNMVEAPCMVGRSGKAVDKFDELVNHGVVGACIITCYPQDLCDTSEYCHFPNTYRYTKFTPECDIATPNKSSSMDMDTPLVLKWMVTTMKTLWFGNIHALVAKFNWPLWSWSILAIHLQTLAKTCLTSQESRYGDC
jgi:hypothetical protein